MLGSRGRREVAWALGRFEMGCERLAPFEALTDYLLARTTNLIERLNQEWRRRIKTQVSFPNESAVLLMVRRL